MKLEDLSEMIIIAPFDGDLETPLYSVTPPNSNVASGIRQIVGVGNPYYAFLTVPFSLANGVVANFVGAPICSADVAENAVAIIAMVETPPLDKVGAA